MALKRIIDYLGLPKTCALGNVIFKKTFTEQGNLSKAEKQLLGEQIDKVIWHYSIKPSSINIDAYKDDQREYPEIEVIEVKVTSKDKVKKVVEMIMTTIPYPMILEVTCQDESLLALGDNVINHNDVSKNVLKEIVMTSWINISRLNNKEQTFLDAIHISHLSSRNLYKLYQDLTGHLVRFNASLLTKEYIEEVNVDIVKEQYDAIEALEKQIEGLKSKIKKESQFNKRLELNVQIKKLEQQKEKMIEGLQGGE